MSSSRSIHQQAPRDLLPETQRLHAAIEAEIRRTGCSIAVATKRVVDRLNRSGHIR